MSKNFKNCIRSDSSLSVKIDGNEIIIPYFKIEPMTFLNKSVIIYGPSGSGKTTILKYIMYIMKDIFPLVLVFNPTNSMKHDFNNIVPSALIHESVSLNILNSVYQRQQISAQIYNEVNKFENLENLFYKIASPEHYNYTNELERLRDNSIKKVELQDYPEIKKKEKRNEINEAFIRQCCTYYKNIIHKERESLKQQNLTNEERRILLYLWHNPHTLMVFDDTTSELLELIKKSNRINKDIEGNIIKNLFFKNRHVKLTHLYTFHDDRGIDSDIRKNAFYSIFATAQGAKAYFDRSTNNFSKYEKKIAESIINTVFNDGPKYAKLLYSRDPINEHQFYYIIAEQCPEFKMCSKNAWQFCNQVYIPDSVNPGNKFTKRFMNL
ncbi:MAG: hypothetical protein QW303_01095 [Nitrososphaerota archaeon]